MLEFLEKRGLDREIERFIAKVKAVIFLGINDPIRSIERELIRYFDGKLAEFKTPIHFSGSPFQNAVWRELICIAYGKTRTYAAQAESIGKPTAYRAVANANGANYIAIVIPCHRIINSNGNLGGYSAGIARKQWLIEHEKKGL
jgi:AraC family transcriptional regulator of adaptative response/methylated-DNA-[protein]-cysteine methyltransferase